MPITQSRTLYSVKKRMERRGYQYEHIYLVRRLCCLATAQTSERFVSFVEMVFTQDERVLIMQHYYCPESYESMIQEFTSAFPDTAAPNMSSIVRLVKKLENYGTVINLKKECWHSVLTMEKLKEIQTIFEWRPKTSLQKAVVHSGINASPSASKMQNYDMNVQTCRRVIVVVNASNKPYMMIECASVLVWQLTAATKMTRKQNRGRCGLFGNDAKPLSLALFMCVYQLLVV